MNKTTIELYEAAIDELESYIAVETNEANVDSTTNKIAEYRIKIMDAAWDDIKHRTARLHSLMCDLQAVIAKASNVPSVSGAIGKLQSLVTNLQQVARKIQ